MLVHFWIHGDKSNSETDQYTDLLTAVLQNIATKIKSIPVKPISIKPKLWPDSWCPSLYVRWPKSGAAWRDLPGANCDALSSSVRDKRPTSQSVSQSAALFVGKSRVCSRQLFEQSHNGGPKPIMPKWAEMRNLCSEWHVSSFCGLPTLSCLISSPNY